MTAAWFFLSFSLVCAASVWLQSSAGSQQNQKRGNNYHRHLCLPFSHGCNTGGVSEIWRLLKEAMGAEPDGDDEGFELWEQ